MEVVWTEPALLDMIQLREFIKTENPSAAARIAERIMEVIGMISVHPAMGRAGRVPHTREMVITGTPFSIAYSVLEDRLVVLRVLHGARKWPT